MGTSGSAAEVVIWNGNSLFLIYILVSYILYLMCVSFLFMKISYFYGV